MTYNRFRIVLLWLCGVLAAAQLGKVSALVPILMTRFGLNLPAAGLLVSLLEVGGAALGFVAGLALPVVGARRALLVGLGLMAVTGLVEATTGQASMLFVARGVEGLGYLFVVIAAPTMIVVATTPGRERDGAMVLWSTFVPVGSGIGSLFTGVAAGSLGTGGAMAAWAFAALAMIVAVARYPDAGVAMRHVALPAPAAWLLSAGFGCYTLCLCAVIALMPTFLHDRHGLDLVVASAIAGLVALAALPGSLLALAAIRVFSGAPDRLLALCSTALAVAACLSLLIFRVAAAPAAVVAALTLLLAGVARAMIFAKLPGFSGGVGAGDPRVASAQGLLTQFGALGALLGPPLGATLVDRQSWPALGAGVAFLVLALLASILGAERVHRRHVAIMARCPSL